jgi:tetratricopeptide (TPR) repeat protein
MTTFSKLPLAAALVLAVPVTALLAQAVPTGEPGKAAPVAVPVEKTAENADAGAKPYQPDWSRFQSNSIFGEAVAPDHVTSDESVDMQTAEAHFEELLGTDMTQAQRTKALLDMADLYHKYNVKPKEAAVYERYIETYPNDLMVPELYMRLGFIYRDIGAFNTSLTKFYSVLNSSLSVNKNGMEAYRQLSLRAQIEIADTYYMMGDYDQAAKFYMRLKRLDLGNAGHAQVDFKYAYTQYLLKDYSATISNFQAFIQAYPDNSLVAESHFVLASAYKQINQPQAALNEVLSLLMYQEQHKEDASTWSYWKKRTGNQMGNEFYEQGDFESALQIYQAMARLSSDPAWLWPSLYQMGLCFERLRLTTKAVDAYNLIQTGADAMQKNGVVMPQQLKDLLDQVKWRKDHLNWQEDTQDQIQKFLSK